MSLFEQVCKDQMKARLHARKNPDSASQKVIVGVLTTFKGEAEKSAKLIDGVKVVADDTIVDLAKKFIKNSNELIKLCELGDSRQQNAFIEITILEAYMPKQMSEDELRVNIQTIIDGLDLAVDIKAMGRVMGAMSKAFGKSFDGSTCNTIVRELLTK